MSLHAKFDALMNESMKDPQVAAAFRAAKERQKRLIESECRHGNCVVLTDPIDPHYEAGWGPVGCPCQDEVSA